MNKLLLRPKPLPENSLSGYLMKVANDNGLTFSAWSDLIGIPSRKFLNPSDITYGRHSSDKYAGSIGLNDNLLRNMIYECERGLTRANSARFKNMDVPLVLMRKLSAPMCPQCAEEELVPPADWDMLLHTSCSLHSLLLHTDCPKCRIPLRWTRGELFRCQCDFSLKDLARTEGRSSPPFANRHHLMQVTTMACFYFSDSAASLDLNILTSQTIGKLNEVVSSAFEAIQNGQEAITTWLRSVAEKRLATNGALGQRWAILPLLIGLPKETKLNDWLRSVLPTEVSVPKDATLSIESISLWEAAVLLKLSAHSVKTLIKKSQLAIAKERSGQVATHIDTRSISQYLVALSSTQPTTTQTSMPTGFMSVTEAAELLGIYPDAIRRVIKAGLLSFQKGKGTQILLQASDVERFRKRYVFVKELAEKWNANSTNLAERLMAVGLVPISGPTIDRGLVYLFNRKEITAQVKQSVMSLDGYQTRAGRKKGNAQELKLSGFLTAQQVADSLKVSIQVVARLVADGHLKESRPDDDSSNRRYISKADFDEYVSRYRDNDQFISTGLAAKRLKLSIHSFRKRFIVRGATQEVSDGLSSYVSVTDLTRIETELGQLISATDAAKLLGAPRYYLNNMVKTGRIKPVGDLRTSDCRYFLRKDVEALRSLLLIGEGVQDSSS